jgi:hypothetical protein
MYVHLISELDNFFHFLCNCLEIKCLFLNCFQIYKITFSIIRRKSFDQIPLNLLPIPEIGFRKVSNFNITSQCEDNSIFFKTMLMFIVS